MQKQNRTNFFLIILLSIVLLCGCGGKDKEVQTVVEDEKIAENAEIVVAADSLDDLENRDLEKNDLEKTELEEKANKDTVSANAVVSANDTVTDTEQLQLLMVGDVLLHTPVNESGRGTRL